MRRNAALFLAACLALLLSVLAQDSPAQTVVDITPSRVYANMGDTVTVEVRVGGATDLRGASLHLLFNKSVLRFVSASQGSFLQGNPDGFTVFFFVTEQPRGSADSVLIDQAIGGLSAVSGDGTLCTVRFIAAQGGESEVAVKALDLRSKENRSVPCTGSGAVVTVNNGSNAAPTRPVLLSPADGATLRHNADTLRWSPSSDPEMDPLTYSVRISGPRLDTLLSGLTDTQLQLAGFALQASARYYWYVQAHDRFSVARSASTYSFTIPAPTSTGALSAADPIHIAGLYPHPARDAATVDYHMPRPGSVRITVVDAVGRETLVASASHETSGLHSTQIPVRNLTPGVCLLRIQNGTVATQRQFIIIR